MQTMPTPIITIKPTNYTSGSTALNTTTPDNSSSSSTGAVSTNTSSTSDTKTSTTAQKLVQWITSLDGTKGDYTAESKVDNTAELDAELEKDPLVTELTTYFSDPITNPTTYKDSPSALLDELTGEKPPSTLSNDAIGLAKQLKTDLITTTTITKWGHHSTTLGQNLELYFGEKDVASVIVDGLRVLKNLTLNDKSVLQYQDEKGVVSWSQGNSGEDSPFGTAHNGDGEAFLSASHNVSVSKNEYMIAGFRDKESGDLIEVLVAGHRQVGSYNTTLNGQLSL